MQYILFIFLFLSLGACSNQDKKELEYAQQVLAEENANDEVIYSDASEENALETKEIDNVNIEDDVIVDNRQKVKQKKIVPQSNGRSELETSNSKKRILEELKKPEIKKTLAQLFKETSESVFLVYAENETNASQGSGFFLTSRGLAISNYHVFEGNNIAIIKTKDGGIYRVKDVIKKDKANDYIVFTVEKPATAAFKPVTVASKLPDVGETCYAIGNPQGLEQTLSTGIVSAIRENVIQTTAQITHGSSGGALFNDQGEVVGITTAGMGEADINFALSVVGLDFGIAIN